MIAIWDGAMRRKLHCDLSRAHRHFADDSPPMPELPEVEVTRRALAPHVEGRTVHRVLGARTSAALADSGEPRAHARRAPLIALERRGKYLLWRFAHGTLISHLGMSGVLARAPRDAAAARRARSRRHRLGRRGPRAAADRPASLRRAALASAACRAGGAHPLLARLGIEPFDPRFDGEAVARRRARPQRHDQAVAARRCNSRRRGQHLRLREPVSRGHPAAHAGDAPVAPRAERLAAERSARCSAEAIEVGGSTLRTSSAPTAPRATSCSTPTSMTGRPALPALRRRRSAESSRDSAPRTSVRAASALASAHAPLRVIPYSSVRRRGRDGRTKPRVI